MGRRKDEGSCGYGVYGGVVENGGEREVKGGDFMDGEEGHGESELVENIGFLRLNDEENAEGEWRVGF